MTLLLLKSLSFDGTGGSESARGGSAIRHHCEGVGTTAGMAGGDEMPEAVMGSTGSYWKTGVQYFGRRSEDQFWPIRSRSRRCEARRPIPTTAGGWRVCCGTDWCKGVSFRPEIFVNCGI